MRTLLRGARRTAANCADRPRPCCFPGRSAASETAATARISAHLVPEQCQSVAVERADAGLTSSTFGCHW